MYGNGTEDGNETDYDKEIARCRAEIEKVWTDYKPSFLCYIGEVDWLTEIWLLEEEKRENGS